MFCYKDQTFCHNWCSNTECFRNFEHTKEAGDTPIAFFITKPEDCTIWKPLVKQE